VLQWNALIVAEESNAWAKAFRYRPATFIIQDPVGLRSNRSGQFFPYSAVVLDWGTTSDVPVASKLSGQPIRQNFLVIC